MSQTSQSLGMPIPEPHVDTWNESMEMVTEALESIDEFAGDTETATDNLESSIAYVESVNAKTNHAVGDYFMLGDVLMCATSAIATGEQITTSNATPATVQSQIDSLRDSVGNSIRLEAITARLPANEYSVSITAPAINGYKFLAWIGCVSQGWTGLVYPALMENSTTSAFVDATSASARNIRCYALYLIDSK